MRAQGLRSSQRKVITASTTETFDDQDLKYLYEVADDENLVREKWEKTYEKRKEIFKGLSKSSDIINKFPCLRKASGYQYVSTGIWIWVFPFRYFVMRNSLFINILQLLLDFDREYKDKSNKLILGWKVFAGKVENKLGLQIPEEASEGKIQVFLFPTRVNNFIIIM